MGRKATRSAEEIAKAKRDMFIRTAEKRVGRILDGLDMLECLSTRYSGYYTEEQVNAMFNAIRKKVDEADQTQVLIQTNCERENKAVFLFR